MGRSLLNRKCVHCRSQTETGGSRNNRNQDLVGDRANSATLRTRRLNLIRRTAGFGATPPLVFVPDQRAAPTRSRRSATTAQRSSPDLRYRQASDPQWALLGAYAVAPGDLRADGLGRFDWVASWPWLGSHSRHFGRSSPHISEGIGLTAPRSRLTAPCAICRCRSQSEPQTWLEIAGASSRTRGSSAARHFIGVVGGAVSWPLTARAQQQKPRLVGVLMATSEDDPDSRDRFDAFRSRLGRGPQSSDRKSLDKGGCRTPTSVPATCLYQTTDPTTNSRRSTTATRRPRRWLEVTWRR
jgi:hypothetical protein